MIRAAFSKIMDYPFLITFNGDDFDLRYLVHRAERLGSSPRRYRSTSCARRPR